MRIVKEVFLMSISALVSHRIRAAMTMLGIAWGIVTVVLLMAYGNGFHSALAYGFRGAFSDGTVVVWPGQTSMQAGGERAGKRIRLMEDDVAAIRELGLIKYVSPELVDTHPIVTGNRQTSALVRGIAPEYGIMRQERVAAGRFIDSEDVAKQRRVVFLGSEVARKLYGNSPVVGESLRIKGISFEVIGVMVDKVQISSYYSPDKQCVFIPYTTVKQVWNQQHIDNIVFQSVDVYQQERLVKQVKEILATRHQFNPADERAVNLFDTTELTKMLSGMTNGLKFILTFIGTLTLMIGGIGVMNIMLVSVTERTREIGTRKALGAKRRYILLQFLMEALVITFLGGILGIIFSYAIVGIVKTRPFLANLLGDSSGQTDIHLLLSPQLLLMASSILIVVGLFSGLWPAMRAARLNPIESLRYE